MQAISEATLCPETLKEVLNETKDIKQRLLSMEEVIKEKASTDGVPQQSHSAIPSMPDDSKVCAIYHKSFATCVKARSHYEVIHLGKPTGFECPVCQRSLSSQRTLSRHMHTHKEKIHECTVCSKMYPTLSTLNTHINKYHPGKNKGTPDQLLCPYCNTIPSRNLNTALAHREACKLRQQEAKYACEVIRCSKRYKHKKENCQDTKEVHINWINI